MRLGIFAAVVFGFAGEARAAIVLNEIDYDQPGTDGAEYVELYNSGAAGVDLDTFTLELVNGNAGGAVVYLTVDLPAFNLAAGDFYVVCANAATVPNCDLDSAPDTNWIQNGAPDAVGLRDAGVLVDAVSYQGDTGAPYTETTGDTGDNAATANLGISRLPDGNDTNHNQNDFSRRCDTPGLPNGAGAAGCPNPLLCGDGAVDAGEACDDGATNGTTVCGCQLGCVYASIDVPCGDLADSECSDPDSCDGGGACGSNDELVGAPCGDDTDDDCTDADACDGAGACLANHAAVDAPCGDPSDTDCTNPDACDGAGLCLVQDEVPGTACGDGSDRDCTDPDTCDGGGACLANDAALGAACGSDVADDCTDPDACDGLGACDANDLSAGTACGDASVTECSRADACDGLGVCLGNDEAAGTACGDASDSDCTSPDGCDGAGACLANDAPVGTACGDATDGDCTDPDDCDGAGTCRANHAADGASCADALFCDGAETCVAGACGPGVDACAAGDYCDEDADECRVATCGDGDVEPGEDCDDGNSDADDGCTDCAVDDGWTCDDAEPSVCTPPEADAGPDAGADAGPRDDAGVVGDAGPDPDAGGSDDSGSHPGEGGCGCGATPRTGHGPSVIFVFAAIAVWLRRRR